MAELPRGTELKFRGWIRKEDLKFNVYSKYSTLALNCCVLKDLIPKFQLQDGIPPRETIKFGSECIELDSWVLRRQYSALKDVLGTGVNFHLQVGSQLD